MPAGETVRIRDDDGNVLFTYRSFASVIGIVAALVASIVIVAGVRGGVFSDRRAQRRHGHRRIGPQRLLRVGHRSCSCRRSTSRCSTTHSPALTIAQKSRSNFPSATFTVVTPDGSPVARPPQVGLLAPRPQPMDDRAAAGYAVEESVRPRAAAKDRREVQPPLRGELSSSTRRTKSRGSSGAPTHTATSTSSRSPAPPLDRRAAVALATLVLGTRA